MITIVTGLLETLWNNMLASGASTSQDLLHLALVFLEDINPAKRLAALRRLLVVDDGRYRELVVQEAISGHDEELVAGLTMTVATELPPEQAVLILERLSTVTTEPLLPAFLALGGRQPQVLVDAYEQKLADATRPAFRAELVTGAGFQGGSAGLGLARLAFGADPDVTVRTRALMVITGNGDAAEAEKTLMAALDDPVFTSDPANLGGILLALANVDDANVLDRIGRRLLGTGKLLPLDRARLQKLLDKSLPNRGK